MAQVAGQPFLTEALQSFLHARLEHCPFPKHTRARHRRVWLLSALRAHTKAPYKIDLRWETLRPLARPGRAGRTEYSKTRTFTHAGHLTVSSSSISAPCTPKLNWIAKTILSQTNKTAP